MRTPMTELLDPSLMLAENERIAQVLHLLDGFMKRPARPARFARPNAAAQQARVEAMAEAFDNDPPE